MTTSDIYQRLAGLCGIAASAAIDAHIRLGESPSPATTLLQERLKRQVLSLTETATQLHAQALIVAIDLIESDLAQIDDVTAAAEAEITAISEVNALLTRIGKILAVGLAVVTLVSQPGGASAKGLIDAINGLSG